MRRAFIGNLVRATFVAGLAIGAAAASAESAAPKAKSLNILVIRGPNVRTVIIRDVPVTRGTPGNATNIALGTLTAAASLN